MAKFKGQFGEQPAAFIQKKIGEQMFTPLKIIKNG